MALLEPVSYTGNRVISAEEFNQIINLLITQGNLQHNDITTINTAIATINGNAGDLASLSTANKTSLVNAINELQVLLAKVGVLDSGGNLIANDSSLLDGKDSTHYEDSANIKYNLTTVKLTLDSILSDLASLDANDIAEVSGKRFLSDEEKAKVQQSPAPLDIIKKDGTVEMVAGYSPVNPQQIAIKKYVDDAVASATGVNVDTFVNKTQYEQDKISSVQTIVVDKAVQQTGNGNTIRDSGKVKSLKGKTEPIFDATDLDKSSWKVSDALKNSILTQNQAYYLEDKVKKINLWEYTGINLGGANVNTYLFGFANFNILNNFKRVVYEYGMINTFPFSYTADDNRHWRAGSSTSNSDLWLYIEKSHIDKVKTLASGDVVNITTSYAGLDYISIAKPTDFIGYNVYSGNVGDYTFEGYTSTYNPISWDDVTNIGKIFAGGSAGNFMVGIAKGSHTLASAQTLISGKKLTYRTTDAVSIQTLKTYLQSINAYGIFENAVYNPKEKLIEDADVSSINTTTYSNVDFIFINKPSDYLFSNSKPSNNDSYISSDYGYAVYDNTWDSVANEYKITARASDTYFYLFIPKGSHTLTTARDLLRGKKLTYQLATPNLMKVVGFNDAVNPVLISRGKNLFNKNQSFTNGYYINTSGELYPLSSWRVSDFIPITNVSHYINFALTTSAVHGYYDINKNFIGYNTIQNNLTPPTNTKYIRLSLRTIDDLNIIQLELGSVATAYEPYKETRLKVGISSSNLFDGVFKANTSISVSAGTQGDLISTTNARTTERIVCQPNTTYSINGGDRNVWRFEDKNGNKIPFINNNVATVTTPSNAYYMYCYYSSNGTHTNVIINRGIPLPYEPYITPTLEPIRSIPLTTVTDEVDFIANKVNGKVKPIKLWEHSSIAEYGTSTNCYGFSFSNFVTNNGLKPSQISTIIAIPQGNNSSIRNHFVGSSGLQMYVEKTEIDAQAGATLTDKLKAWLQLKNCIGYFEQATPTVKDLVIDTNLQLGYVNGTYQGFSGGQTEISSDTGIIPSYNVEYALNIAGQVIHNSDNIREIYDELEHDEKRLDDIETRATTIETTRNIKTYTTLEQLGLTDASLTGTTDQKLTTLINAMPDGSELSLVVTDSMPNLYAVCPSVYGLLIVHKRINNRVYITFTQHDTSKKWFGIYYNTTFKGWQEVANKKDLFDVVYINQGVYDGVTDNATEIQNAINSIGSYGTIVFPHKATVRINSMITIPKGKNITLDFNNAFVFSFVRDGVSPAIKYENSPTGVLPYLSGAPMSSHVIIRDLNLIGGNFSDYSHPTHGVKTSTDGLYMIGCHNLTLDNVRVYGFEKTGIRLHECYHVSGKVKVEFCKQYGLWLNGSNGCNIEVHADNNQVGARLEALYGTVLRQPTFQGNYGNGLEIHNGYGIHLDTAYFEQNNLNQVANQGGLVISGTYSNTIKITNGIFAGDPSKMFDGSNRINGNRHMTSNALNVVLDCVRVMGNLSGNANFTPINLTGGSVLCMGSEYDETYFTGAGSWQFGETNLRAKEYLYFRQNALVTHGKKFMFYNNSGGVASEIYEDGANLVINTNQGRLMINNVIMDVYRSASTPPANPVDGMKWFSTLLRKELTYDVATSKWYDQTGILSYGTTADRDALTLKYHGHRFWNTTTGTVNMWSGSSWI